MYCYRSFLSRRKECLEKTSRLFKEWEEKNKLLEERKRAEVKQLAVNQIDTNYQTFIGSKIEDQNLKTVDKLEGAEVLRSMLSYTNRVLVLATKICSSSFDALLKEAEALAMRRSKGDESFNSELATFAQKHKQLSIKINAITKNYQTYSDLYRPKLLGLRFEENIQNSIETLDATKFLIIEAFEMEKALPDMLLQLQDNSFKDNVNKQKVKEVTKREIILQKVYWARKKLEIANTNDNRKDLDFTLKLCSFEFPEDNSICNEMGAKE